ncbi:1-acyl-sn-glycerol-3-phosphate acyltransferase [bacterium CPR1]|nr:1-acyl-sn-glycerol-3-phosphate acyltransferase [bacterium CPR1]
METEPQLEPVVETEPQHEHPPDTSSHKNKLAFALAAGAAAAASFFLFRFLNRTRVEGLENIPDSHQNVLYCLNHNSILDNFAFETAVYVPKLFFKPQYLPVQLADRKTFFGEPGSRKLKDRVLHLLGKHFLRHLRAVPVDRKKGDLGQVDHWAELVKNNIVVVFPEGTRTRTGQIGKGKAGVGKLIYQARPTVVPVRMLGMREVMGVGRFIPGMFQTVRIIIGQPLDLSSLLDTALPDGLEPRLDYYKQISETVLDAIRALHPE